MVISKQPSSKGEHEMSTLAHDLVELAAYRVRGALTEHLLRELALNLIAPGVADMRGGL
jgi:hypothetical protein